MSVMVRLDIDVRANNKGTIEWIAIQKYRTENVIHIIVIPYTSFYICNYNSKTLVNPFNIWKYFSGSIK